MQVSEAREIVNNRELNENWQRLTQDEADMLMDEVESEENRQECCFPYDCMHHEACGEGYPCGSCKRGAERRAVVNKILDKFPLGYQYATALTRMGEQQIIAHKLQDAKDLEAVGDYRGAARLLGDDSDW